jgi:hypothetical protein
MSQLEIMTLKDKIKGIFPVCAFDLIFYFFYFYNMNKIVKYVLTWYEKFGPIKNEFTYLLYDDETLLQWFEDLERRYWKENFVITRIYKDAN